MIFEKKCVDQPFILFMTGASGAGKTTILNLLAKTHIIKNLEIAYIHFDSIGVPTNEEMVKSYGSERKWQEAMMHIWAGKILYEYHKVDLVIFEGQVDIQFIIDAVKKLNFFNYDIILIHCERKIRNIRLIKERNQSNLANQDMENWANYLKNQANQLNISILETSNQTKKQSLNWISNYLKL